jgi:hypothetical protein
MNRNPSTEELLNNSNFELINEVEYSNLKPFIFDEIGKKSFIIKIYGILQIAALVILTVIISIYFVGLIKNGLYKREILTIGFSVLFSFTLLIPVHELIHATAFLILGKKDIGFGMQWKKFLFYAESNRQVINRKEMVIVALAPFISVLIAGLGCFLFANSKVVSLSGLVIVLLHFMFCGGDFAIISFFNRNKPFEMYTFDDRSLKKSYFFRRITQPQVSEF